MSTGVAYAVPRLSRLRAGDDLWRDATVCLHATAAGRAAATSRCRRRGDVAGGRAALERRLHALESMTYLDPQAIAERARRLDPPVVSLYVPAWPGTGNSAREAAVRAHAALVDLDIDVSVRRRVEQRLEIELARPRRGTLALFADRERIICGWLRGVVEADERSGAAHAHAGPHRSVAEPRGLGDIAGLSRWSLPAH